jgi:DNA mismatch repair protein MutS
VRPRELAGLRATLAALPALRSACPMARRCSAELHTRCNRMRPSPSAAAPWPRARGAAARRRRHRPGVDAELDELRAINQNCDAFLLDLEQRERARTGIGNLRVQFNKVHGFYIEVTRAGLDKVPPTTSAGRR